MKIRLLLLAVFPPGILCTGLLGAPISGTFNIAGTIKVTTSTITWQSNNLPFPADKTTIGPFASGDFSSLGGTDATVQDLDIATEPVGPVFPPALFMSFDAAPTLPALDINHIFPGIYSTAACLAPPAVGQTCTPSVPITPVISPFNFVNNPGGNGPEATATFVFNGITADGLSKWSGNFTSQFSVPYQTVLDTLFTTGIVINTYSGTIIVTPLPEPGPEALVGIGLGLVALSLKMRRPQQR